MQTIAIGRKEWQLFEQGDVIFILHDGAVDLNRFQTLWETRHNIVLKLPMSLLEV